MSVPNDFNPLTNDTFPDVWSTLSKIRHTLGWSEKELLERMKLPKRTFLALMNRKAAPSVYSVNELVSEIGLSLESIVTGKIDYLALQAHSLGDIFYVPARYIHAAFSRRRTSINLLEYIEKLMGWDARKRILDHFQLTDAVFADPDAHINFLFPSDLCEYLVRSGYSPSIFPNMGAHSIVTNKHTPLGTLMASFETPLKLHESTFGDIVGQSFDRNCNYRLLELTEESCLIGANFTQELQDLLRLKKPGNIQACSVRGGSFSTLTGYLDLPRSEVIEETCVHRGDASCTYRIIYGRAQNMSKKLSALVANSRHVH